jgi:hypothetical protein
MLVLSLECHARVHIVADSHEDELRLRRWFRCALERRGHALPSGIIEWLDLLDEREAA